MTRLPLCRLSSLIFLLLATLAVSGCCKPEQDTTFGGNENGLYPIFGGANGPLASDKIAEFDRLPKGWESSEATVLRDQMLGASIESNKTTTGADHQRYNYVIQEVKGKNEILVATWSFAGKRPGDKVNFDTVCGQGGSQYPIGEVVSGAMVDIWPEDGSLPDLPDPAAPQASFPTIDRLDPCKSWSYNLVKKKTVEVGVRDAHSKHFMLAQGSGTTLKDYSKRTGTVWKTTLVKYAGEIIVDVKTCTYLINQGSGTYKPVAGSPLGTFDYLKSVATLFKDKVGVGPTLLWEKPPTGGTGTMPFVQKTAIIPGCSPETT